MAVNQFWSYITPLAGAYIADEHLGRFKTIMYAIACALVGHTILIISAIPPVIKTPNGSIAAFAVGLVIMGMGTGGFKYVFAVEKVNLIYTTVSLLNMTKPQVQHRSPYCRTIHRDPDVHPDHQERRANYY